MTTPNLVPLRFHEAPEGAEAAAKAFRDRLRTRRSVREFSDRPVSRETIEALVATAASAPSGANKQPWRFVAVSDPALKREIRLAAEEEERLFYEKRASQEWLRDLAPLGTDSSKPFLERAPWLIVLFKCMKDDRPDRSSDLVYYVNESVGIAAGFLIAAIHHAGLATLTHTPSPMAFLQKLLHRPEHERAFLLLPVGYPADDARVPSIVRKPLDEVLVFDRPEAPPEDAPSS
ncbi:MAG: nitroreductase family protein [Phycisphaerales bacterium]